MNTPPPPVRDEPNLYVRKLTSIVGAVARVPGLALLVLGLWTVATVVYSAQTLRINSDDAPLTPQDAPFRLDYQTYVGAFPQFDETTLIVLTSDSFALAEDAIERLSAALKANTEVISTVFAPGIDDFTKDHAFLYLDLEDFEEVALSLAEAQPALTALTSDPSLRGLFGEFELSLDALVETGELPTGFARMADRVSDVAESLLVGEPRKIAWMDEILGQDDEVYRVILVQGVKDFDQSVSTARLIHTIRDTARELGITPERGVTLRLTGQVPLAHDEIEALQSGLVMAGSLSVLLLTIILGFGVRSLRIVVATFVTLGASLSWSTAFAMATVGEFNIISAAFGVLLIGLGVDFALHIGLRYEEETSRGVPVPEALERAATGVGGAVSLCSVTSAIGFLSFVPTRYYGLGALGIIAGGGMLISLAASFSVFPAMLAIMGAPSRKPVGDGGLAGRLYPVLLRNSRAVVAVAGVIALAAIGLTTRTTFDFSTLSMRDPDSESVRTLMELHEEGIVTDYAAIAIADDFEASFEMADRLGVLEEVSEVRPPSYYVPEDQDEKLLQLDDVTFFLEPFLNPPPALPPPDRFQQLAAFESLRAQIGELPDSDESADPESWEAIRRLGANLTKLADRPDVASTIDVLDELVVSDLPERMEWLRRAVMPNEVNFDDLPAEVRERVVAPGGQTLVSAIPRDDLRDLDALTRFVGAVADVAPHATGRPAVEAGIGDIVVTAFQQAIGLALVVISVVLIVTLRDAVDALLVLAPITLAAFLTIATGVLIDMPFNMTNVVVVPLVLGLGVDNGIHVFMRVRGDHSLSAAMTSSTPRAVLLSALTTLAAFASLAVSGHPGIYSIGVLLSVAVVALIVSALVVLPALIVVAGRNEG